MIYKYALNISAEDNRILSACKILPKGNYDNMVKVSELPKEGNVNDYKWEDGYVYDPIPAKEIVEEIIEAPSLASLEERILQNEADIAFLAMMSDVDLEV